MQHSLEGFRISVRHPEPGTSDMIEKILLVIARSQSEAVAIARQKCPLPCSTDVLENGPNVLQAAQERGLQEGEAVKV